MTITDPVRLRGQARLAVALIVVSGVCVSLGIVMTWMLDPRSYSPVGFAGGCVLAGVCLRVASWYQDGYDQWLASLPNRPRGARLMLVGPAYLSWQAHRAAIPERRVKALVWAAWTFPVGFIAFLWVAFFWALATG